MTALYELVPAGKQPCRGPDGSRIAVDSDPPNTNARRHWPCGGTRDELLTLKLRYKQPRRRAEPIAGISDQRLWPGICWGHGRFQIRRLRSPVRHAAANSPYKGHGTFAAAAELAQEGRGSDAQGYRGS